MAGDREPGIGRQVRPDDVGGRRHRAILDRDSCPLAGGRAGAKVVPRRTAATIRGHRLGATIMHTPNTARTNPIHASLLRRMAELARRAQVLHVDPRSVQAIRFALSS
jgi:hypothetical protein